MRDQFKAAWKCYQRSQSSPFSSPLEGFNSLLNPGARSRRRRFQADSIFSSRRLLGHVLLGQAGSLRTPNIVRT